MLFCVSVCQCLFMTVLNPGIITLGPPVFDTSQPEILSLNNHWKKIENMPFCTINTISTLIVCNFMFIQQKHTIFIHVHLFIYFLKFFIYLFYFSKFQFQVNDLSSSAPSCIASACTAFPCVPPCFNSLGLVMYKFYVRFQ